MNELIQSGAEIFDDVEAVEVLMTQKQAPATNTHKDHGKAVMTLQSKPNLAKVTDAAVTVLRSVKDIYHNGSELVRCTNGKIEPLNAVMLSYLISKETGCDLTTREAESVLAKGEWEGVRYLKGITDHSVIDLDGYEVNGGGYHEKHQLYFNENGCYCQIPEHPTKDDALEAVRWLNDELLCDVLFDSEDDRTAAIAGMMTAALKPVLSSAPLLHINAGMRGVGKSTLSDICSSIACGKSTGGTKFADEEEMTKKMLSYAIAGAPVVLFDNATRHFNDATLCTATTEGRIAGRALGGNKLIDLPYTAFTMTNGNNVMPINDLATRAIMCRLNTNMARPEERVFKKKDPTEGGFNSFCMVNRSGILSRLLTIVKAWQIAQKADNLSSFPNASRFSEWNRLIRDPIMWLGLGDPLASIKKALASNPAENRDAEANRLLWIVFNTQPFKVSDICHNAKLVAMLSDVTGNQDIGNSRKMRSWLDNRKDQHHGGLFIREATKKDNTARYRLEGDADNSCPPLTEEEKKIFENAPEFVRSGMAQSVF